MKIPMPWEKGIVADIRRSLFKMALKRRFRKLTRSNRETMFALVVGALALGLFIRGAGLILSRTVSKTERNRSKVAENAP